MATIQPGYMGSANIEGVGTIRFTDANIARKQSVETPDIIMGQPYRYTYHWSGIEVSGSIGGPISCTTGGSLWEKATARNGDCGRLDELDVTVGYTCGEGLKFKGLANSISYSCSAGDVAQFTLDLLGKEVSETTPPTTPTTPEQLVTWDQVTVDGVFSGENVQSFEITVNNNAQSIYKLGSGNLYPTEILGGLPNVTGSVTIYGMAIEGGALSGCSNYEPQPIVFGIGDVLSLNLLALLHRVEPKASVGPFTSTIAFTVIGTL